MKTGGRGSARTVHMAIEHGLDDAGRRRDKDLIAHLKNNYREFSAQKFAWAYMRAARIGPEAEALLRELWEHMIAEAAKSDTGPL